MKKILMIILVATLLTACTSTKVVYTQEEVKYLETMKSAVEQMENYTKKFDAALADRSSKKTEDNAKDLFAGAMAFGMINEVIKKETPPKRFEEAHKEFQKAVGLFDEASIPLSMGQKVDENKKKFEEAIQSFKKSSKVIMDSYTEATKK